MALQRILFLSVQFLLMNNIHSQTCRRNISSAIEKNRRCEKCPVGYNSENNHCNQCAEGSYGDRCSFKCDCEANERCDHVFGCINSTTSTEQFSQLTIAPMKERDPPNSTPQSNYVVIYMSSIATVGATVIIAIALWRQKDWIKKRLNSRNLRFPRLQGKSNADEELKQKAFVRKSENVYEDINERYMLKDFEKMDFI